MLIDKNLIKVAFQEENSYAKVDISFMPILFPGFYDELEKEGFYLEHDGELEDYFTLEYKYDQYYGNIKFYAGLYGQKYEGWIDINAYDDFSIEYIEYYADRS